MNDIELKGTGNKYDWNFTETDLVDVNGDASLVSAIRHTLLLHRNELEQVLYNGKGNLLEEIVLEGDTDSSCELAKQTIDEECRQINGITKAESEITLTDNTLDVKQIRITKNDGEEIKIGL